MGSWRFTAILTVFTGTFAFLFFHLYQIQIQKSSYYVARAESQYLASGMLASKRGTIYFSDKNGTRLAVAVNQDAPIIYAVPKVIEDVPETLNRLELIFSDTVPDLAQKLSKKDSSYQLLERKADPAIAEKISSEQIKGIYVETAPERSYPFASLASQLLGFVAPNSNDEGESGKYGVEKFYENVLSGIPGKTDGGAIVEPRDGQDVALTIDPNIQAEAKRLLEGLVKNNNAKGGALIVEEPSTGKILAMEGVPNFDPNDYAKADVGDFLNPNVQKIYEPGSVLKVITMAAGIDSGAITPQTTYTDTGTVLLNGYRISNYDLKTHGPYGLATMTNVIEHSINTGAVFAEKKIGNDTFRNYLVKFGLQDKSGIDLPGELKGSLKPLFAKGARQVAFATASYGQGIAVTPIGLLTAMGAIANNGVMMRPYVNAALEPKEVGAVVSPSAARQVTNMMISAVDKAGVAAIKGYSIAGKTGTAYIPDFQNGGYTNKVIDTYIGFGPASNPRFIALIKIDGVPSDQLAALTVVPAFRDLAQFVLNYYNIPPDRL